MPGYVIHLAVAEEYLKKHANKKEQYNDFIEGVIFPDSVKDKSETHYGQGSSESNLYKFLQEKKIDNSFNRGYFLHLMTDYLFYNKYIEYFSKDIYNDYDLINKGLMEKYNVVLPEKIKGFVFFKEGTDYKIITPKLTEQFIEDVSKLDIEQVAEEVIKDKEKWTTIRPLKKI